MTTLSLDSYKYDAERCPRCKGCKWVDHIYMPGVRFGIKCPSIARYLFDAYSCYGRLKIALDLMNGQLSFTPRLVDVIYRCHLCGACDVGCKRNLDLEPLLLLESLRARCVQEGKGPLPQHQKVATNIEKSGNRYGAPYETRSAWLPQGVKPAGKADILYFVGCASSYERTEIAQATARILAAADIPFMLLGAAEWCCGHPAYVTGQIDLACKMAQRNLEAIAKTGASTVLTSCAECYQTLKVTYPKLMQKSTQDLDFKIVHLADYAAQLLESGRLKLKNRLEMKVTYHDSCHLARLSEPWVHWEGKRGQWGTLEPPKEFRRGTYGLYQPPRTILQNISGVELVEMTRIRENAWCCGAGGGVKEQFPDFALWTARERLEEARITGAETLVAACPYCKDNLKQAASKRKEKIQVLDIAEIISQAIV